MTTRFSKIYDVTNQKWIFVERIYGDFKPCDDISKPLVPRTKPEPEKEKED